MKFSPPYFLAAILLFITEVLLALYIHDGFFRPYFGDTLVVILIYCSVKTFLDVRVRPAALGVLLFAFLIEFLQYCNFIYLLGWEDSKLARTVIGHSASWADVLAYLGGYILILIWEKLLKRTPSLSK